MQDGNCGWRNSGENHGKIAKKLVMAARYRKISWMELVDNATSIVRNYDLDNFWIGSR